MQAILDFLISLLPASIVSFIVGYGSCWFALVLFIRSKHFKRWLKEETIKTVEEHIKNLKESNARHSKAIIDMEKRIEKIETQNAHMLPMLDQMSKDIKEIYKLMVQKGGD